MQLPTKKVVITRVMSDPTNFRTFPILTRFNFIQQHFSLLTFHYSLLRVAAFIVAATAAGTTGVDHQCRGLTRHREVTGIDTLILGELNR